MPDRDERGTEAAESARSGFARSGPCRCSAETASLDAGSRGPTAQPRPPTAPSPPLRRPLPGKSRLTCYMELRQPQAEQRQQRPGAAAAPRSLGLCSSKLPLLAVPLIHKGWRGQQRQAGRNHFLTGRGWFPSQILLDVSLRLPTHLPFRSIPHLSSSLSSAAADREQPIGIEDSLSVTPSHRNTPSAFEIL